MSALPDRFWRKVSKTEGGCWSWTGAMNSKGYGCVAVSKKTYLTHRVAYTALVGPIPDGMTIDHLCRNKQCVNPAHLEPVTIAENIARAHEKHIPCPHGVVLTYRKGRAHSGHCSSCVAGRHEFSRAFLAALPRTA